MSAFNMLYVATARTFFGVFIFRALGLALKQPEHNLTSSGNRQLKLISYISYFLALVANGFTD